MARSKALSRELRRSGRKSDLVLIVTWSVATILIFSLTATPLPAREKEAIQYGMGLIVNVPRPEREVTQVVQDVIQNGIIRGTKEYNKDQYISGAAPATSTRVFPEWTEGGKVFYKVRLNALDPRNFKNSNDTGTLAVRYVVQPQGDKHTVLRIDAVFVDDFRHVFHPSNGSVEGAEYKEIQDHLDSIESMKSQTAEAEQEHEKAREKAKETQPAPPQVSAKLADAPLSALQPTPTSTAAAEPPSTPASPSIPQSPPQTLEQHIHELERQVQRLVKAPGAPLKSAPFHTAATLRSLPTGTEVLIEISTPYWLGVETHQGQRGWVLRDELEMLQ